MHNYILIFVSIALVAVSWIMFRLEIHMKVVAVISFIVLLYYVLMGYVEITYGFESVNNYSIELAIADSKSRFDSIVYHMVLISILYFVSMMSYFGKKHASGSRENESVQ